MTLTDRQQAMVIADPAFADVIARVRSGKRSAAPPNAQGMRRPARRSVRATTRQSLETRHSGVDRLACVHRGEKVGTALGPPCPKSGSRETVPTYACRIHGLCNRFFDVTEPPSRSCRSCKDRLAVHADASRFEPQKRYASPTYLSHARLAEDTLSLVPHLPEDVSVVIGVARSGMAPASILAMALHRPLYAMTKAGIVDCGHGWRLGTGKPHRMAEGTALIVDDTVMTGGSLRHARAIAAKHFPKRMHVNVYCNPESKDRPDLFAAWLPSPHLLEWNLFNSVYLRHAAFDFDGILCRDFTREECADEALYAKTLGEMRPLRLPRKDPIHIITARKEKYREQTLAWLSRWRIAAASLAMAPSGLAHRDVAEWKSSVLKPLFGSMRPIKRFGGPLYIESDPRQAEQIAKLSKHLVACPTNAKCYTGKRLAPAQYAEIRRMEAQG